MEDGELFPFQLDEVKGSAPAQRRARKISVVQIDDKPHYHDHRARLRKRFDEAGPEALADYELLELMLFRTIPRRDTKPLAKALLTRFGDLAGVLAAPPARIAEVDGAGPSVAQDLKVAHALLARAQRAEIKQRPVVSCGVLLVAARELLPHEHGARAARTVPRAIP